MGAYYRAPAVVIGGGPAAYTAAIYLARSGRQPIVITGPEPGGQLTLTTEVENFPGFRSPIQGPWLMEEMAQQAAAYGAILHQDTVVHVNFGVRPFFCQGLKDQYESQTVIVATGASPKWLGIEGEAFFRGYGVSSCATCDGRLFREKEVMVIGGGNTAAEEALTLAQHAKRVTIVHRRAHLRAEKILQDRLFAHPKIRFLWEHVVEEILGNSDPRGVTEVRVCHVSTGVKTVYPVQGVFVAIGHHPNTNLVKPWLPTDEEGYILTESPKTGIEGIFVAGDVRDKVYRQAITAAGEGCKAAMEAERFLQRCE